MIFFRYSSIYDKQLAILSNVKDIDFTTREQQVHRFLESFVGNHIELVEKLFQEMNQLLGLSVEPVVIYILPDLYGTISAFSDPCTIPLSRKVETGVKEFNTTEILCLILHELAHRVTAYKEKYLLSLNYPPLVRNHILVYALLQKVLPAEMFALEEQKATKDINYLGAMRIIHQKSAERIIDHAKGS